MPEFEHAEPCTRPVKQRGTGTLLGFCTRRVDHPGGCATMVDDRTTHNIREQ